MTAPDLRTAAQTLADDVARRIDALRHPPTRTTVHGSVVLSVLEQLEPLAADVRSALAAEATEPPPDALAELTQRLDLATDHTDGDGATLLLALHFPGLDPDTTDPDALADKVAGNSGSSVEVSGIPVPQWLSSGAVAAVRELLALPAASGSAPNPQGADEPAVIWTCPPCRRGEHGDCMDAGTGTCQCAQNDHGTAAGVPDEPGDDDPTDPARLEAVLRELDDPEPWPECPTVGELLDIWQGLAHKVAGEILRLRAEVERLRAERDAAVRAAAADGLLAAHARGVFQGMRAVVPASEDDERKPWTFDVEYVGGPQPTDYGTGTEWDGSYQWAIFNGPSQETDVVLLGFAEDEDPTPVLAALVAEHNRAGPPPPTPAPEQETTDGR